MKAEKGVGPCGSACPGGQPLKRDGQPRRVQLSRRKGWKKPDNTTVVARPSRWGNPWTIADLREEWQGAEDPTEPAPRAAVVESFRGWLQGTLRCEGGHPATAAKRDQVLGALATLRGRNLACWCPLDQPCHADVLLELANA